MSDQPQRPTNDDPAAWRAYWQVQGMPWRTEPEIDEEQQRFLAERRGVTPDIEHGIYPFKNIKLGRADVEWLLATHGSGDFHEPVDWSDERQRRREGLDVRGANLRAADLRELPLARLRGGLTYDEWLHFTVQQGEMAAAHLEGASLVAAHLEGAFLCQAYLERAFVGQAHLEGAELAGAYLERAELEEAYLEGAHLRAAYLERAFLDKAHLEGADLRAAHLEGTELAEAHLERKTYTSDDADLMRIQRWVQDFPQALSPADLRRAFLSAATSLNGICLGDATGGTVTVADVRWGGVNLAVVDWTPFTERKARLGDEQAARKVKQVEPFQAAVRANRQLATVLREQGMNEEADYFAYRAQMLQREVFRRQRSWGRWLFSWLLAVLAGYGYRLGNILLAYALTLIVFAAAYLLVGLPATHPMPTLQAVGDAFQVSLTAIHGRVFFEQFGIGSALAWVAAVESVVGIVIEGVFVAMLVQRFFAR